MRSSVARTFLVGAMCLSLSSWAQTTDQDLHRWRAWYREASVTNQATLMAQRMEDDLSQRSDLNGHALASGFQAVAELMIAEHAWNPVDKLSQFLDWQPVLESALEALPRHPDLALLRLGVQSHVPAILDYQGDRDRDRGVVVAALADGHWSDDPEHDAFVRDFLTYLKSL